jgi:hypothetical protein
MTRKYSCVTALGVGVLGVVLALGVGGEMLRQSDLGIDFAFAATPHLLRVTLGLKSEDKDLLQNILGAPTLDTGFPIMNGCREYGTFNSMTGEYAQGTECAVSW